MADWEKIIIKLDGYTLGKGWPRCFYNPELLCGEPDTGKYLGYNQETEDKSWHVADMCNCPSCPLRVMIAAAVRKEKNVQEA